MKSTGIVFPHQLFEKTVLLDTCSRIYLVEEFLFFNQYNFHKQKITFHRASMKFYESYLLDKEIEVVYIESTNALSDIRNLIPFLKAEGVESIAYIDPVDNWLEKRISESCLLHQVLELKYPSSMFLNSSNEISQFFGEKKKMFQTDFYKAQRIKRKILLENSDKPLGGKWTFDAENRLKYPKGKKPPEVKPLQLNGFYKEAIAYTEQHFQHNYGQVNTSFLYPATFKETQNWLDDFLQNRFSEFGLYEDAMVEGQSVLHHSILTPMMNVGLITPQQVLDKTLHFASENEIPLNSLEGFIRQILGWREFIRAVYQLKGTEERTRNYWGFKRKIPASFWNGTTGIEPIDSTIKMVLKTGYCHHIERLMVLGNFMLLCEFDPNEVYRWFMEMFIDSYDWVMVPNVYGMSQFADGGLMATKPYISGSNYLLKMSDFKKGPWQEIWDGLFWRFMHVHRDFFLSNPRLGMLVGTFDKMASEKQKAHLEKAEGFLGRLS
jgi:deoxyribodipyrimidine photolyase-related protein